jgi:hypothetical protein
VSPQGKGKGRGTEQTGLHSHSWDPESLFLGAVPAAMDLGRIECSRFLFRHGSGTDVRWCKAVSGGRDTSTMAEVWYCGVCLAGVTCRTKGSIHKRLSVPSRDREAFRHSRQGRVQLVAVHRHTSRVRVKGAYALTRESCFLDLDGRWCWWWWWCASSLLRISLDREGHVRCI